MDKIDKYLNEGMDPEEKVIIDYLSSQRSVYHDALKHALKSLKAGKAFYMLNSYVKSELKLWRDKTDFDVKKGY